MSQEAFYPAIDAGTNVVTCVQKTSANASDTVVLPAQSILVKCHTYPVYIRFVPINGTVTAANGFYMAAGDYHRFQITKKATHLAVINVTTDEHGVLSIMPGDGE